jgi:hypothetical protein
MSSKHSPKQRDYTNYYCLSNSWNEFSASKEKYYSPLSINTPQKEPKKEFLPWNLPPLYNSATTPISDPPKRTNKMSKKPLKKPKNTINTATFKTPFNGIEFILFAKEIRKT